MKNKIKFLTIIAVIAAIKIIFTACQLPEPEPEQKLPALTGTVSINGIAEVGQTLTANTSSLGGNGMITFQWLRGGNVVGSNVTYAVTAADIGSTITVTVARSGYIGSITSAPTATVPSILAGTVRIDGTAEVGQTLTANTDLLGGNGTISYQWNRRTVNGITENIGTNSDTYIVQSADFGSTITVTVTRSGCSGSVTSDPLYHVGLPPLTGTVTITGTAEVGQTLTANTDSLGGSGTISYQWKRGTTNIGTDSNTYVLINADAGSIITVIVTRVDNSGSITSVPTAIVPFPALTGTLTIVGNTWVGQLLTANTDDMNGIGTYSYVWKRGDTAETVNTTITGANQKTYTLAQVDVGKYIAVTVTTSSNPGSVTGVAVGPVITIAPEMTVPGTDLAAKLAWLKTNAKSNAAYLVTVGKAESLSGVAFSGSTSNNNYLSYGGNNIIIRLMGIGGEQTVNLSSNGFLFIVDYGVTLILDNNITLQGRGGNNSSLVYVGGVLEMNTGSKISGNTVSSSHNYNDPLGGHYSGGVYVGGTFIMNGGEISGNSSSIGFREGGGVRVSGTFTMNGGEISGNTAREGGGVYVSGTFDINGGKISGNYADSYGGGMYINEYAFFTMNGGEISGNTASRGGGVYITSYGRTITMNGGKISGNTASSGSSGGVCIDGRSNSFFTMSNSAVISGNTGGGVNVSYGNFTMNGGKIFDNNANESSGGGVSVYYGTFTINGGEISSNTASSVGRSSGGGVYVYGTFTMSGGKITGNTSKSSSTESLGGGVWSNGTFTMSGGEIAGNISSSSSYGILYSYGSGVYVDSGTFTKTGGTIYGYTAGDSNSNVIIDSSGTVKNNGGHAVYAKTNNRVNRRETTAGPTVNLDSAIAGTAGGWEN